MSEAFDFIVVGSGAGSMIAAMVMRDAGKQVLVLEKASTLGGTTATSGGVMWIPNNRYMAEQGVSDSTEAALNYLNAIAEDDFPGANAERRKTYVEKSPEALEYLIDKGLQFRRVPYWPDYYQVEGQSEPGRTVVSELFNLKQLGDWQAKLRPGFIPVAAYLEEAMELPNMKRSLKSLGTLLKVIGRTLGSRLTGKHLATAGQALQAQLLHRALAMGVEIRTEAKVTEIITTGDRVTGIAVEHNGNKSVITASLGVLLNAGGFAKNQAMLDQYLPGCKTEWSGTCESDTGDMINAGANIGAATAQMDQRVGYPVTMVPGKDQPVFMQGDMAKPHSVLVDQQGQRFMKEAASYMALSKGIYDHNKKTPAIPSWFIFDSQFAKKYMVAGGYLKDKTAQAWQSAGFLKMADSIQALAEQCQLDSQALTATVNRFNTFAENGKDEDFNRGDQVYDNWLGDSLTEGSKTLGPINQGPFYALPIYPGDVSTFGGLVTDNHGQVIKTDGNAIAGLYATGVTTASVMGKTAPGAGASIGPALTWGYLAAQHALSNT